MGVDRLYVRLAIHCACADAPCDLPKADGGLAVMGHTGVGANGEVYTIVAGETVWAPLASVAGCAPAVAASVATGETRTIPTECDTVVSGRFILHGTGALVLQGDATLKVM